MQLRARVQRTVLSPAGRSMTTVMSLIDVTPSYYVCFACLMVFSGRICSRFCTLNFLKGGSSIATSSVLEESRDPTLYC